MAIARRLRQVQIDQDDALKCIQRYDSPDTLFLCDPPYMAETRGRWSAHAYQHEMTTEQHRHLAEVLLSIQGAVVVCGYPHPLYDEWYAGWQRETKAVTSDAGLARVEVLWIKPMATVQPRLIA